MNKFLLHGIGFFLSLTIAGPAAAADRAPGGNSISDVVVYGATPGGIAAAIAASREGASVLLLEALRTRLRMAGLYVDRNLIVLKESDVETKSFLAELEKQGNR